MIEVKDLVKTYNNNVVLNIPEMIIQSGEIFGLVGNNGDGKTTFITLLLNLIKPDNGFIKIDGINTIQRMSQKKYAGFFLDESFLIDFLTPEEYFIFVAALHDYSKEKAIEMMEPYGVILKDDIYCKKKIIRQFAKHDQKKIGIVAALFIFPKIIILDEPFADLDLPSVIFLKRIINDLSTKKSITFLISSQDHNEVNDICNHIVFLKKGNITKKVKTHANNLQELETVFDFATTNGFSVFE
jgi:ABC-2 type transport system ATP-binding protein